MVWKELLVGFTIAGAVAALVPASFFEALFPTEGSAWWVVPVQALLAPLLAVMTFIGSMGNGPLAAVLANNGVVFGAIMTFLYADFSAAGVEDQRQVLRLALRRVPGCGVHGDRRRHRHRGARLVRSGRVAAR